MPSNTVFKKERDSAYRDDPLAELSRIMGLQEEARSQSEDDFGIDLEQELLGEFAEGPAASAGPSVPTGSHPADDTGEDALAAEIDSAFDDIFADPAQSGMAATKEMASAVQPADERIEDVSFDDGDFAFDEALAELDAVDPAFAAAPAAEAADERESSLEDELRALLAAPAAAGAPAADPAAAMVAADDPVYEVAPPSGEQAWPEAASDHEGIASDEGPADEAIADLDLHADDLAVAFSQSDFDIAEPAEQEQVYTAGTDAASVAEDETAPLDAAAWDFEPADDFQAEPQPVTAADEIAYADEAVAYSDEPVAYADASDFASGEPSPYSDSEPAAYSDNDPAAYAGNEPEFYANEVGAAAMPADEAGQPSLETVDFSEFEQELLADNGAFDPEAPAEDDVESFAAEPGEWLSAEAEDEGRPAAGELYEPAASDEAVVAPSYEASAPAASYDEGTVVGLPASDFVAGTVEENVPVAGAYAGEEAALPDEAVDFGEFDAAFDALGEDTWAEAATPGPVAAAEPADDSADFDAGPQAAADDFDDAFELDLTADFAEEQPAAEQPAPVQPSAASAPPPKDESGDEDPFAALAAMAAAPPILKAFGRTNPVAVSPVAARPGAAAAATASQDLPPVKPAEPVVAPTPPENYFSVIRRPRETVEPVQQPAAAAAVPAAAAATAFAPSGAAAAMPVRPDAAHAAPKPAPALPELDTVEVAESHVPVADELDLPDLPAFEAGTTAGSYDDEFESDFSDAYQQLTVRQAAQPAWQSQSQSAQQARQPEPEMIDEDFEAALQADLARVDAVNAGFGVPAHDAADRRLARDADLDDYDAAAPRRQPSYAADDEYAVAEGFAEEPEAPVDEDRSRRRGLLIAAVVAGVALAGGVGAFALSFGSGDSTPALVRADPDPVKVKPENPGGLVVPNQDGKVYERVAGAGPSAPEQENLVTSVEEPIEPVVQQAAAQAPAAGELPGVETPQIKSEDRVVPEEPAAADASGGEVAAVAPRKVRTMIVRPDGTLVPREDPPAPAAAETPAPAVGPTIAAAAATDAGALVENENVAAVPPAPQVANAAEGAVDPVSILPDGAQGVTAPTAEESAGSTPVDAEDVVVPRPRPARTAAAEAPEPTPQPRAAPEPEPAQVAAAPAAPAAAPAAEAAEPAAAAPAGDLWQVQIASQPTQEGAQASYQDMARRYSNVLGGKPVNIVQAEIPNKGTFWRVRIPAASKSDANILCAKLKTAGGSCFVSK